jgi:hypothetical protein
VSSSKSRAVSRFEAILRARYLEILDKSIAAMVSAIEIYNKPDFRYREETFSVLCINSWELLLKAYTLKKNGNRVNSLYVYEPVLKKDGTKSKRIKVKLTRSKNPFTHSLDFLAKKYVNDKELDEVVWQNIQVVTEIRDSAVHFYNKSGAFSVRLQEVGSASLKNYVTVVKNWFNIDFSGYNFYLMPISFINPPNKLDAIHLSKEERNIVEFIESLEPAENPESAYSVAINVNINFTKSKVKDAINVQISNDPNAIKVQLTDEQFKTRWPMDYEKLTKECRRRYLGFKLSQTYHKIRQSVHENPKYCGTRHLDPGNPKGATKTFYSHAIFNLLDKEYTRKT